MTDSTAETQAQQAHQLRDDRVELRPITIPAAADLRSGGKGGFAWVHDGPFGGTLDACGALLKADAAGVYQQAWGAWAVIRRADGLAIGGCGFHGAPLDGVVEIGYDLAASARGQGFASAAARLVTAYALAHDGVDLVVAHTDPANAASQAVLTRVGFARDGADGDLFRFVHPRR
ncbi:GNAT family N-acetyltransferase [Streptacidiphilus sp. MAP5-3]|uniref:GNAT family N-acetyltransferase n=1 Tax=unclassified Streptacidiphilus TaxID=2643834 RepID=UPI0035150357